MKLTTEQHAVLRQVSDWKRKPPNVVARVADRVFAPMSRAVGRLVPRAVRARLLSTVEATLGNFVEGRVQLGSPAALKATARSRTMDTGVCTAPLHRRVRKLEPSAYRCVDTATVLASAEGFGIGAFGWCGVFADIPAQLAIQLQMIRQMGKLHGFNTRTPAEAIYALRVLDVGTAPRLEDKTRALEEAARLGDSLSSVAQAKAGEAALVGVGLSTVQQMTNTICARLMAPRLAHAVPLAGAGVGASFNYVTTREVGMAAFHLYRERLIKEQQPRLTDARRDAA